LKRREVNPRRAAGLAAGLARAASVAGAHPLSVSYSRFEASPEALAAVVRLPMDDIDLLLQLDADLDDAVTLEEARAKRQAVSDYLRARVSAQAGGRPLPLSLADLALWKDGDGFPYLEARLRGPAPPGDAPLVLQVTVLADLYADHRNLAEAVMGAERRQFVFQGGNTWRVERGSGVWRTVREFTVLGIQHIFTGYDHVLFLVGLLLVARGFRSLVAIVTSFTVAHSITLALATLGAVDPVGWMVEAAIALSIAYVGIENLVAREVRHRWLLTFAFGLVHGFGFAGILREMELDKGGLVASLVAFNLGVELGQVAIVALLWPALRALQRAAWRERVVRAASAVIVGFGLYWFVERIA
jgi:hypothetical protein